MLQSNTFASRPIFAGEWASELEMSVMLSSMESRQFISGYDERPVSMAWMCFAYSPKHSSMLLKPDLLPKMENHGVHAWAGMTMQSGEASSTIFISSCAEKPKIGRPSETTLPLLPNSLFIFSTVSKDGAKIRLCIFLVF